MKKQLLLTLALFTTSISAEYYSNKISQLIQDYKNEKYDVVMKNADDIIAITKSHNDKKFAKTYKALANEKVKTAELNKKAKELNDNIFTQYFEAFKLLTKDDIERPRLMFKMAEFLEKRYKKYENAIMYYELIFQEHFGSEFAEKAKLRVCEIYKKMGLYDEAFYQYEIFLKDYGSNENKRDVYKKILDMYEDKQISLNSADLWYKDYFKYQDNHEKSVEEQIDYFENKYLENANYDQLQQKYESLLEETPDVYPEKRAKILEKIAENYERVKDYKSAINALSQIINKFPDNKKNPFYLYKIAEITENDLSKFYPKTVNGKRYYKKSFKNYQESIKLYESIANKYPKSYFAAKGLYKASMVYRNIYRRDHEEIRLLKKIVNDYDDSEFHDMAKSRIEEID